MARRHRRAGVTVSELFTEAVIGLKSLFVGLGVTGKAFTRPSVTVLYPKREVTNLDTYRGHVELVGKDDGSGLARCIACGACSRACPSQCLTVACPVDGGSGGAAGREATEMIGELIPKAAVMAPAPQKGCKTPGLFMYDYSLCSLCGQCVKACPVDSLRFSRHVYFVGARREDFHLDLLARLRRQTEGAASADSPQKEPT
jgi:NADH-quinone oxidoreductase subunit I